jgi:hypothetical protein
MDTYHKRWEVKLREVRSTILTMAGRGDISAGAGFVQEVSPREIVLFVPNRSLDRGAFVLGAAPQTDKR